MERLISLITFFVLLFSAGIHAEVKSLKIGSDDWPPYEFKAGAPGHEYVTGFSTEVVQAVLKKMGVGIVKIEQYPWARGEKMVIDGSIDMLFTAASSEARAQITYYPSESLMESSWAFFIRKEDEGKLKYESLNDLKGKRIGVVRAYAYTPEFWKFVETEKNIEEVSGDHANLKKLQAKRFEMIVMDYGNGLALIKSMGLSDQIVPIQNPLKSISLYSIFTRNALVDKDFVDRYSSALKTFKATPEYKVIFDKYFGK